MGAFGCHGNESFDRIHPQMLTKLFPHPIDAIYNIWSRLANLPQEIFKFESVDGPFVYYYKLILWVFDSGELNTEFYFYLS